MIPAEPLEETQSEGERTLHPLLRDRLDSRYTVFHSFHTMTPDTQGVLHDGEVDFLIFSPERGFLVLEVKSGTVIYDGPSGRWYLNGMPIHDPFHQARSGRYSVEHLLRRRLGRPAQCGFAYAVCFPHTTGEPSALPPHAERPILLTASDLDSLPTRVQEVFAAFGVTDRPLGEREVEQLRGAVMPLCEYGMRLTDRLGTEERQLFALTEEQCHMLEFIRNQRSALIRGCAGSGKTVMAVKKARELALEGRSVLLLAFNQMIGHQLAAGVADLTNVVAGTYHGLCIAMLSEAGKLPEGERNDDYYTRVLPEAFFELVGSGGHRFDAIIVDEGQDFRSEYWLTIQCLLRDEGLFYIFYDPEQNVFGTEMDFPIKGEPFLLSENCRNTKAICDYVGRHTAQPVRPMDRSPEGLPVEEHTLPSAAGRRRKVGAILNHLIDEEKLAPERIVILGGHRLEGTSIPPGSRVADFTVVEGEGGPPGAVHYYTYMKFKGCEADAVILLDVDEADPRWTPRAVYTTASRAKHLLYIVRAA
jgi:hypothetical protein